MELSLERIADAVMALRIDLRDRPDLERRQLPRFPVWAPRVIQPTGPRAAAPFEVWLIDIACGGVGFLSRSGLDVGTELYITIPGAEVAEVHALCRVVHCRQAANGSYLVGAQFVEEVTAKPVAADHSTVRGSAA